jgi:hypothetical protein
MHSEDKACKSTHGCHMGNLVNLTSLGKPPSMPVDLPKRNLRLPAKGITLFLAASGYNFFQNGGCIIRFLLADSGFDH